MNRLVKRLMEWTSLGVMGGFALVLGGCAYDGQGLDDPITRRAVWYSYSGGDDIRQRCGAGGPDQYRLIYNGNWNDQVRIYDLGGPKGRLVMHEQILQGLSVDLITINADDLLAPWRGNQADLTLSETEYATVVTSLVQSGLFQPPPVGLRLPSDGYYWTAVGCRNGQFVFNAWLYPSPPFLALSFPDILMDLDRTSVPFGEPVPAGQDLRQDVRTREEQRWTIQVGEKGLF